MVSFPVYGLLYFCQMLFSITCMDSSLSATLIMIASQKIAIVVDVHPPLCLINVLIRVLMMPNVEEDNVWGDNVA